MSVQLADGEQPRSTARRVAIIAALSNLSIQYNFGAIAIALAMMDQPSSSRSGGASEEAEAGSGGAYPRTDAEQSLLKYIVFAGAIAGQLTMGYVGDAIGRKRAMGLTYSFSTLGALGSALLPWGSASSVYAILAGCRFVLGFGVGGKYPLAATMSRESVAAPSASSSAGHRPLPASYEVAKGFFWQSPGAMLPYVVGLVLIALFGRGDIGAAHVAQTSAQFRLLLGVGALPTLVAHVLTHFGEESAEYAAARRKRGAAANPFREAARHPQYLGRLAGCGLSWFCFDIVIYGTTFNQVAITQAVFGKSDTLFDECWQNIVITAMGIPGVLLAMLWTRVGLSSRALNLYGFALFVAACLAFAGAVRAGASSSVQFALFCVLYGVLNFGPNLSTYVLPTEMFPTEVRSTFFGLAAGMGKVGALLGSGLFGQIAEAIGVDGVYFMCAGVSLLGMVVTWLFIPRRVDGIGTATSSLAAADSAGP